MCLYAEGVRRSVASERPTSSCDFVVALVRFYLSARHAQCQKSKSRTMIGIGMPSSQRSMPRPIRCLRCHSLLLLITTVRCTVSSYSSTYAPRLVHMGGPLSDIQRVTCRCLALTLAITKKDIRTRPKWFQLVGGWSRRPKLERQSLYVTRWFVVVRRLLIACGR